MKRDIEKDLREMHYVINHAVALKAHREKMAIVAYAQDAAGDFRRNVERCQKCGAFRSHDKDCTKCEHLDDKVMIILAKVLGENNDKEIGEATQKVESLISELSKRGPDGKSKAWKNRSETIGVIPKETVKQINEANREIGIVDGTRFVVDIDQLNHALMEHGKESKKDKIRGEVPIDENDLKLIPTILSNYDIISDGRGRVEGKKQDAVEFWMKGKDGTFMCVEIDDTEGKNKERVLKFQTMMKFAHL